MMRSLFRSGRLPRTIAVACVSVVAAGVAVLVTPAAAQAHTVGPCRNIWAFNVMFVTGDDDLRGNSFLEIGLMQGELHEAHTTGVADHMPANTISRVYLLNLLRWDGHFDRVGIDSCSITGVRVALRSHPGPGETADNWDMRAISLVGFDDTGTAYTFSASARRPAVVKRFSEIGYSWVGRNFDWD